MRIKPRQNALHHFGPIGAEPVMVGTANHHQVRMLRIGVMQPKRSGEWGAPVIRTVNQKHCRLGVSHRGDAILHFFHIEAVPQADPEERRLDQRPRNHPGRPLGHAHFVAYELIRLANIACTCCLDRQPSEGWSQGKALHQIGASARESVPEYRAGVNLIAEPVCPRGDVSGLIDAPRNASAGCAAAALVDQKASVSPVQQPFGAAQHVLPASQAAVDEQYRTALRALRCEEPAPQVDSIRGADRYVFPRSRMRAGDSFGTGRVYRSRDHRTDEESVQSQGPESRDNGEGTRIAIRLAREGMADWTPTGPDWFPGIACALNRYVLIY